MSFSTKKINKMDAFYGEEWIVMVGTTLDRSADTGFCWVDCAGAHYLNAHVKKFNGF